MHFIALRALSALDLHPTGTNQTRRYTRDPNPPLYIFSLFFLFYFAIQPDKSAREYNGHYTLSQRAACVFYFLRPARAIIHAYAYRERFRVQRGNRRRSFAVFAVNWSFAGVCWKIRSIRALSACEVNFERCAYGCCNEKCGWKLEVIYWVKFFSLLKCWMFKWIW